MFFLLRVIIVVAVVFYLSPLRDDRHGASVDISALSTLSGGFWPLAARWWTAVPEPVREGLASQALERLSRPEPVLHAVDRASPVDAPRSEADRPRRDSARADRAVPTR
jgi:hypothetical protein